VEERREEDLLNGNKGRGNTIFQVIPRHLPARLDLAQQDRKDNRLHEVDENDELKAGQLQTRLVHCELRFLVESPVEPDNGADGPAKEEATEDLDPDVCVFGVPGALAVAVRGFGYEFEDRQQDVNDAIYENADVADVVPSQAASWDHCVRACRLELAFRFVVLNGGEIGEAGVFIRGYVFDVEQEEGCKGEGLVQVD